VLIKEELQSKFAGLAIDEAPKPPEGAELLTD